MHRTPVVITAAFALAVGGLSPVVASAAATPSAPAPAPKVVTRLAPVSGLQIARSSSGERLRWSDPAGTDYVGIQVRRTVGRIAPASPKSGTAIANLAPGATTLVDGSVEARAVYSYAVFAMYSNARHAAPAVSGAVTAASISPASGPGGGSFTGVVTDSAGHPLKGVEVRVTDVPTVVSATSGISFFQLRSHSARTAADGTFTVSHLSTASYQLCYDAAEQNVTGGDSPLGYDDLCPTDAVEAHSGSATSLGTVKLADNSGGVVTGRVVDGSTNSPIAGIQVDVFSQNAGQFVPTDARGAYTLRLPAGTYTVCFDPEFANTETASTGYVAQCNDTSPVVVNVGEVTTLNADLAEGGAVSGIVKSAADGSPIAGIAVSTQQPDGAFGFAVTAGDGTYVLKGLSDFRARICADGFPSAPTDGSGTGFSHACTSVLPKAGATVSAPDIAVAPAGGVSGTVTAGGHPLAGVNVTVETQRSGYGTFTAADGTYLITGIQAGTYNVCFQGLSYPAQCYNNRTGGERPNRVTVAGGEVTAGIDAAFGKAPGAIKVTVQDSTGHKLVGADAVLVQRCGRTSDQNCFPAPVFGHPNTVAGSQLTGADGSVTFNGIAPGGYAACAFGRYASGGTSTTRYQDACSDVTFSTVVTAGATASVTVTLQDGAAVTGTVTDSGGHPLAGVTVVPQTGDLAESQNFADLPRTAADGTYRLEGLPGGTTAVCFDATGVTTGSPTGYASQCYHNALRHPTPIAVTNGVVTTGIDVQLKTGAEITGTVTGVGGAPVADVTVDVAGPLGDMFASTAPDGTYALAGLPPGSYIVCFQADGVPDAPPTGYVDQCYNNATNTSPLPFLLRAGQVRTGIDAQLQPGGEITGSVTGSGAALHDGVAFLFLHTPTWQAGYASEVVDGSYGFTDLPPGNYTVCVDGAPSGFSAQCFDTIVWRGMNYPAPKGVTKVSVAAGQTATVANMDLAPLGA